MGTVRAEEKGKDKNVTEDQILRALGARRKKPLTRGLSAARSSRSIGSSCRESKLVQKVRGRSTRSLSISGARGDRRRRQGQPKIDLEINFDYNSADVSAKSLPSVEGARTRIDQLGSEGLDLRGRRSHRCGCGGTRPAYNQDLSERRADSSSVIWSTNTASTVPIW